MNLNIYDLDQCVRRLPKPLKTIMMKHGEIIVVAGGYIRSVITGEKVSDVDVFAGEKKVSEIFATELQGDNSFHKTDNAFTVKKLSLPIQFIFRWIHDTPLGVMESFDFTICQAALWFNLEEKKWDSICSERFYQDLAGKRIIYLSPVRNEDAGGSILRVLKYYQRGYRIPLDSLAAIMSRLFVAVDWERLEEIDGTLEINATKVLAGLLFEVDPNGAIDHTAYLPSSEEVNQINNIVEESLDV